MATSKLQRIVGNKLDAAFPNCRVRENYRPDWLISSSYTKLELDFYIEELNVAFEVQGMQHFAFMSFFFRTEDEFRKRQKYDQEKRDLCKGRGVKLYQILTETDVIIAIKEIMSRFYFEDTKPYYANQSALDAELDEIESRMIANRKLKVSHFSTVKIAAKRKRLQKQEEANRQRTEWRERPDVQDVKGLEAISIIKIRRGESLDFDFTPRPNGINYPLLQDIKKRLLKCETKQDIRKLFRDILLGM